MGLLGKLGGIAKGVGKVALGGGLGGLAVKGLGGLAKKAKGGLNTGDPATLATRTAEFNKLRGAEPGRPVMKGDVMQTVRGLSSKRRMSR